MHSRALVQLSRPICIDFVSLSVNDAGKELSDHPGRVTAFLDFLGAPPDDPRRGESTLYSSHDFGEAPKKVFSRWACFVCRRWRRLS